MASAHGAERHPRDGSRSDTGRSWPLAALSFTTASIVLTWLVDEQPLSLFISGSVTLLAVLLLSWAWKREQAISPSPVSEYHAVAYSVAFYVALIVTLDESRSEALQWAVLIPPVSFLPLLVRRSTARRWSRDRAGALARRMHLAAAGLFSVSAAFFLLTVIAIVLMPIPVVGAAFHLGAARFYRQDRHDVA